MTTAAHIGLARTKARKVLAEMKIKQAPVLLRDVINYLQQQYDMAELAAYAVDDFSEKVSGILVMKDDTPTIGYNNKQHRHRQRFTVAHELGHLLVGSTVCGNDNVLSGGFSPSEVEANQFAAELLMPRELLKKDLQKGNLRIPELSRKYWVSEEALGWRVRDLLSVIK